MKVTTVSPTAYSSGPSFTMLDVTSPSLLSIAVALAKKVTIALSLAATTSDGISTSNAIGAGTVSSGGVISRLTVTTVWAVPVLPTASTAVKVTVVSPSGNTSAGTSLVTVAMAPSTLSVAVIDAKKSVTCASLTANPSFSPKKVIVAGAVMTGAVKSATVTVAVALAEFPAASLTEKVTTVSPIGRTSGASFVIVNEESTLSVAVAVANQA